jgi:arsenate reductase
MSIVVYQYPNCSTCKKALRFLDEAGVDFKSKDIVASPPSKAFLAKALRLSGLPFKKLFNTAGKSYREGGFKDKLPTMSDDQALTALAKDGKLIRRPLVLGDGFALVGFRENEWREALAHKPNRR